MTLLTYKPSKKAPSSKKRFTVCIRFSPPPFRVKQQTGTTVATRGKTRGQSPASKSQHWNPWNRRNVFLRNYYQEETISKEHQFLFSCGSHIEKRRNFGKAISLKGKTQEYFWTAAVCTLLFSPTKSRTLN